jgi:hypothetical protein
MATSAFTQEFVQITKITYGDSILKQYSMC